MDRGTASLALFLCLVSSSSSLWTLTCARNLFDSSNIIEIIDHPNPEDANSILGKSQELIEEPSPFIQFQPNKPDEDQPETEPTKPETAPEDESNNKETTPSKPSNPNNNNDAAPFTVLRISSMDDPRIPRRPLPLGLRLRHRCRHDNSDQYKAWTPRRSSNYMTMSKPELDQEFDKVARNWVRQVPAELLRVRHIEPMLLSREAELERERERKINMALDRSELWRKIYLRRHHHKQPNEEEQQQEQNKNNNTLMKRIRKFLSHF
ncbi:hypothetical protein PIB30_020203 [Stylosanthes scabra]|uniref:Uncharacterized protein n=1 Tax=Stylosanthes scabra TaxID=79078 RepID=A0ABU6S8A6_9FABA|nr:hypothetical protein [Stylosanthes scabra]